MAADDIIFSTYCKERSITYELTYGIPTDDGYGWSHIVHRKHISKDKSYVIKNAVENQEKSFLDKDNLDRERIYSLGADPDMPRMYVAVVAHYENENKGTITTAWYSLDIPESVLVNGVVNYDKNA